MTFRLTLLIATLASASAASAQQQQVTVEVPTASWPIAVASLRVNDTIRVWSSAPAMYGRPLLLIRSVSDSVVVRMLPGHGDWWAGVAGSNISAIDVGYSNRSRHRAVAHGLIGAATGFAAGGVIGFLIGGGDDENELHGGIEVHDRIGGTGSVQRALYSGAAGAAVGFAIGWQHGRKPFLSWSPLYRARASRANEAEGRQPVK